MNLDALGVAHPLRLVGEVRDAGGPPEHPRGADLGPAPLQALPLGRPALLHEREDAVVVHDLALTSELKNELNNE